MTATIGRRTDPFSRDGLVTIHTAAAMRLKSTNAPLMRNAAVSPKPTTRDRSTIGARDRARRA